MEPQKINLAKRVDRNHITLHSHHLTVEKVDSSLANPSCTDCYGTGKVGNMMTGPKTKVSIKCACVSRAESSKVEGKLDVPWIRRKARLSRSSADAASVLAIINPQEAS